MCTLTYHPKSNSDFILASNRDVMRLRSSASLPSNFESEGIKLYFSRDGRAGGTWLGYTQFNRLICLLNGAFDFYIPEPPYRKSRGQIVLDCLKLRSFDELIVYKDFDEIEPFTMIIIDWSKGINLHEIRWDGKKKYSKILKNEIILKDQDKENITYASKITSKIRKIIIILYFDHPPI